MGKYSTTMYSGKGKVDETFVELWMVFTLVFLMQTMKIRGCTPTCFSRGGVTSKLSFDYFLQTFHDAVQLLCFLMIPCNLFLVSSIDGISFLANSRSVTLEEVVLQFCY